MMPNVVMRKLDDDLTHAIRFDGRVMISGERGTGKKFAARFIHQRSRRATAAFVIANRRNFGEPPSEPSSDAAHPFKDGLLTTARNGTLLIEGIETLTGPMQLQLLQFLEHGPTNGSPRLMTAAATDVFERVRSDDFRDDLFYRLNVLHLVLPALRGRPEDILFLFHHFLACSAKPDVPVCSPAVLQRLVDYSWPGNVQELKAVAESLAVKDLPRRVESDDLPSHIPG